MVERVLPRLRSAWHEFAATARRLGDRLAASAARAARELRERWRSREARRRAASLEGESIPSEQASLAPEPQLPGVSVLVQPEDDAGAVIGCIDGAAGTEIVLVVPRAVRGMRRAGAWAHVAAHAHRRGLDVRVLAARADVRAHAAGSGLSAARTMGGLPRAQRRSIGLGGVALPMPRIGLGAAFRATVLLAFAAGLFAVGCVVLPSARITVIPTTGLVTESATVRVNPLTLDPDVALGIVPGATLRETVTTIVSTATTGTALLGDAPASVELRFDLEAALPLELPSGTLVRDDSGVEFALDAAVTVLPGESEVATATAVAPGEASNVAAGTLIVLAGFDPALTVTNPEAASGGTDIEVAAVASEDVDRVSALSLEVLERIGIRQMEARVEGGRLFPQTVEVSIASQTPLQQLDEPAGAFLMEYTAVVTALAVTEGAARAYADALIASRLDADRTLLPGASTVRFGEQSEVAAGAWTIELVASGLVAPRLDSEELRGQLTGVRPEVAAERVQVALGLEQPPVIVIQPEWLPWRWMPRRDGRITIVMEAPTIAGPPTEASPQDAPTTSGALN